MSIFQPPPEEIQKLIRQADDKIKDSFWDFLGKNKDYDAAAKLYIKAANQSLVEDNQKKSN